MYVALHNALPPDYEACLRNKPLERRQEPTLMSLLPEEIRRV